MASQDLEAFLGPPASSPAQTQMAAPANTGSLDDFLGAPPQPSFMDTALSSIKKYGKYALVNPYAEDLARGFMQVPSDAAAAVQNLGSTVTGGLIPKTQAYQYVQPDTNPYAAGAGQLLGSLAIPGGSLLRAAKTGAEAIVAGAGLGGLYGSLFGESNPSASPEDIIQSGIQGATLGGGISAIGPALTKGAQSLSQNRLNMLESKSANPNVDMNTPEQAQSILNDAKVLGIKPELDLGSLTNYPFYKGAYQVGAMIPLSNTKQSMNNTVGQVSQAANNIYGKITNGIEPSYQEIISRVKNADEAGSKKFNQIYSNFFDKADKAGVRNLQLPNIQSGAQDAMTQFGAILNEPEFKGIKSFFERYAAPVGNISAATGVRSNNLSLSDLKQMRTQMSSEINALTQKDIPYELKGAIYDLRNKINDDILFNLERSGKPSLFAEFNKISSDYKNERVPFQNLKIQNVLSGKSGDQMAINSLIHPQNRAILNQLDQQTKNLIFANQAKNAVQDIERDSGKYAANVDVQKLVKGYSSLDKANKALLDQLLPPELQSQLNSLKNLNQVIAPYRAIVSPPQTGVQIKEYTTKLVPVLGAYQAIKQGLKGIATAAGELGAGAMINKTIANALRNPQVLKAYANPNERAELLRNLPILENLKKANLGRVIPGLEYLTNQGNQ